MPGTPVSSRTGRGPGSALSQALAAAHQVGSREDKALPVALDHAVQLSVRSSARLIKMNIESGTVSPVFKSLWRYAQVPERLTMVEPVRPRCWGVLDLVYEVAVIPAAQVPRPGTG